MCSDVQAFQMAFAKQQKQKKKKNAKIGNGAHAQCTRTLSQCAVWRRLEHVIFHCLTD